MDKREVIEKRNIKITKEDLKKILEGLKLDYDISSIPDNLTITNYKIDNTNIGDPVLNITFSESPDVYGFEKIDSFVISARGYFRITSKNKRLEIQEVVNLFLKFVRSIGKFKTPDEWKNTKEEYFLGSIFKSLQMVLGIYYLCESGFFDLSLALKRNYVELLLVSIAIGYDKQCFIDWKNKRDHFTDAHKIAKRICKSTKVPELEKGLIPRLLKYWNESSQTDSHQLNIENIEGINKDGIINFGMRTINEDVQNMRLNTIRNMIINILCVTLGVFNYGETAKANPKKYPEALGLIAEYNNYKDLQSKNEPTI